MQLPSNDGHQIYLITVAQLAPVHYQYCTWKGKKNIASLAAKITYLDQKDEVEGSSPHGCQLPITSATQLSDDPRWICDHSLSR